MSSTGGKERLAMQLSRRDFLKISAPVTGMLVLGRMPVSAGLTQNPTTASGIAEKAMLYDASKCVGCRACQTACRSWNGLPPESIGYGGIYDNPSELSATTWTLIKFKELRASDIKELLFCKYQCMHCTEAACVKVCPTGALYHHELGFVAYNKDICSGCGYCTEFCPFQVPHLSGSTLTGLEKMDKCNFCTDRVTNNQQPACVEACPAKALIFGDRNELVTEGKKRVDELRKSYPNATLYGENELGGLHVMYVLKEPPNVYELPQDPQVPAVAIAWQDVIQPLGWALGGLTILGLGLNYLVAREAKLTRELPGKKEE